jgi:hypothetical protein
MNRTQTLSFTAAYGTGWRTNRLSHSHASWAGFLRLRFHHATGNRSKRGMHLAVRARDRYALHAAGFHAPWPERPWRGFACRRLPGWAAAMPWDAPAAAASLYRRLAS